MNECHKKNNQACRFRYNIFFTLCAFIIAFSTSSSVFSSIVFPKNSFPEIIQNISKAEDRNFIDGTKKNDSTNSFEMYNAENNVKTFFYNDRVVFEQTKKIHWEMRLQQYGYADSSAKALIDARFVSPEISKNTVTYQHDEKITQWFINSDLGMEHGIRLTSPPVEVGGSVSSKLLVFNFSVSGSVDFVQRDADIAITDRDGNVLFWYHNLIAFDENNQSLPVTMRVKEDGLSILVDASSATYPIYVDPLFATEKKLKGEDEADLFGYSVTTSEDTIVVGAPGRSNVGTTDGLVYVYRKNSSGRNIWGKIKNLSASISVDGSGFGKAVALDASIIAVGAPNENSGAGAVYVFYRDEGGVQNWGQVKRIVSSDIAAGDFFGASVSLSGGMLVVGAPAESGSGAVYVFDVYENGINNWGEIKKITPVSPVISGRFGASVHLDAETLVVGAPGEGENTGAAYVFYGAEDTVDVLANIGAWGQVASLTASSVAVNAEFGQAVSIYFDDIVVGAPFNLNDESGSKFGSAYIFNRDQGGVDNWGQTTKLTGDSTSISDNFGFTVSLHQTHVAVGANKEGGNGKIYGAAYIFEQDKNAPASWPLLKKHLSSEVESLDTSVNNLFSGAGDASLYGVSVDISGDTFVVGGSENVSLGSGSENVSLGSGSAYIYATSVDLALSGIQPSATDINEWVTYNFTITNNDINYSATGAVFKASFSSSFSVDNASSSVDSCTISTDIICNLGSIQKNTSDVTIQIQGNVTSFGLYSVRATVEADQSDAVPENNTMAFEAVLKDTRGINNSVDLVGCSLSSSNSFDITLLLLVVFSFVALMKRKSDVSLF